LSKQKREKVEKGGGRGRAVFSRKKHSPRGTPILCRRSSRPQIKDKKGTSSKMRIGRKIKRKRREKKDSGP